MSLSLFFVYSQVFYRKESGNRSIWDVALRVHKKVNIQVT